MLKEINDKRSDTWVSTFKGKWETQKYFPWKEIEEEFCGFKESK